MFSSSNFDARNSNVNYNYNCVDYSKYNDAIFNKQCYLTLPFRQDWDFIMTSAPKPWEQSAILSSSVALTTT